MCPHSGKSDNVTVGGKVLKVKEIFPKMDFEETLMLKSALTIVSISLNV